MSALFGHSFNSQVLAALESRSDIFDLLPDLLIDMCADNDVHA